MTGGVLSILEGADHDSPHLIQYCPVDLQPHPNAHVLRVRKARLIRINPDNISNPEGFKRVVDRYAKVKGFELLDHNEKSPDWVNQVFSMPRSLTTLDGRFFLSDIFSREGFSNYFGSIPLILEDTQKVYAKNLSNTDVIGRTYLKIEDIN